jgi:hypothetical protein
LELKVERYNPEVGLYFLSRIFVDPLNTNTTMQDPLRTLRKLHLTTRDPTIPLADAACDRVEGYLCTDRLTPLISEYCQMVLRLYGPQASANDVRDARRSRNKEKPYWMTCDGSWPQHPQDAQLMKQILVNRTGIDMDKVDHLIGRFAAMNDVWEQITYDTESSSVSHTIDEEGVVPGSVDESFTKLNDAKQTRANPGTSRPRPRRNVESNNNELSGRTQQRASGSRQPAGLSKQIKVNNQQNGNLTVRKTNSDSLPRRSGPTGRKTNSRRETPQVGTQAKRDRT